MEDQTIVPELPATLGQRKSYINYLQVALFVSVYIALGYLLKVDANAYLLLGVPLTIIFQLFVRKQPLHKLWVRDSSNFRLGRLGIALAIVFTIEPVRQLISIFMHHKQEPVLVMYLVVATAGTIGAGFGFSRLNKKGFKQLLFCLLVAGSIGVGLMLLVSLAASLAKGVPVHFNLKKGITSLLLYIPVCFVMEEVIFRGMLDTHVNPQHNAKGIGSAFFISALWGLWHLPVYDGDVANLPAVAITYIIVHSLVGIPLSIYWRKSGNLSVPVFTHAFIDAVRNALMHAG